MRTSLLAWFDRNARQLPWRSDPTPYHVWVSEIMLQQTQVATVLEYYRRFIAAYPTVGDLAAAEEHDLMRLWEGLGYYRRARSMHAAAKLVVSQHDGQFPSTYEEVLALPGIGRYTAGAILSISGDQRLPVLEGNTVRVYSRWIGLRQDVQSTAGKAKLWEFAAMMLPRTGSGQFNQAAMELGALICKPKSPACDTCPVQKSCVAHSLGLQDEIPGKVSKVQYESRTEYGFVVPVIDSDRFLICRVPDGNRWAGLWDFPRCTDPNATTPTAAASALSHQLGIKIRPRRLITTIKHAVTRYRITLQVHLAEPVALSDITLPSDAFRFVTSEHITDVPLSVTGRQIAQWIAEEKPASHRKGEADLDPSDGSAVALSTRQKKT
ncbi:MAG TPA: A/G-specific adenine glycosylase [Planctomycetaceae bacterium]|nr:A/G-specific adenine glycosylase [Planctomycetaceae bacterium]